ncbi:hypothetical protein [Effusibacillus dendaii]|nr:hypothetical protein [Effusibacillus dendaii]
MVVPRQDASNVLEKTKHLLKTEHVLQEKIRAGATIGQLINIDEVF